MNQDNNDSNTGNPRLRGPDLGTTTGGTGIRRQTKQKPEWNRNKLSKSTFSGKTKEMNRHIMQNKLKASTKHTEFDEENAVNKITQQHNGLKYIRVHCFEQGKD